MEHDLRNTYKIFIDTLEVKRLLGGHNHRCEDNVKLDVNASGFSSPLLFMQMRVFRSVKTQLS